MELHYAKKWIFFEGEQEEFQTWEWNDDTYSHNHGWVKKKKPEFIATEVAGDSSSFPKNFAEQWNKERFGMTEEQWYELSNEEDLIMMSREVHMVKKLESDLKKEIYGKN
jgi:hypothetical protein